jgi:hypothetical protein
LYKHVLYDAVRDAPANKVELGNSRGESVKVYPARAAKRVEQLLGVAVKARLVGHVDRKYLTVGRSVRHVLVLRVVRYEPLEPAQGDALAVVQNIAELLPMLWNIKKSRQARQEKVGLAHLIS